jgi:hypothetical protein
MKFKTPVSVNVLSPMSLRRAVEFKEAVRAYCELLPDLLPEKWGWYEPLDRAFDVGNLDQLVPSGGGDCETVDWKRNKRPKAEGSFSVRWKSKSPKVYDTHSMINFTAEIAEIGQEKMIEFVKKFSVQSKAHIGFIEVFTESYSSFALNSGSVPSGDHFFLVTHVLRHWLPDVFWGTVFGPPYVDLFGKNSLLSSPVWIAEEIAENVIYLQLSENIVDLVERPSLVQDCRLAVKKHIAVDAFYDMGRGYDRLMRGPNGDVFITPKFELLDV